MVPKSVLDKVKSLPLSPGVYLMRDGRGEVIYVGKALRLRQRVRSYFQAYHQRHDHKVLTLAQAIADLEVIVTRTEVDALVLEEQLIKSYQPRYNVLLKDDKRSPYLRLSLDEPYPKLSIERTFERDGARYFGPYTNAQLAHETLNALRRLFPVRTCNDAIRERATRRRPCLDFFIKTCPAPCTLQSSPQAYRNTVARLCDFLSGRDGALLKPLKREMDAASEALDFERAAQFRDTLQALEALSARPKALSASSLSARDVVGAAWGEEGCAVQVFFVREGAIKGREQVFLDVPQGTSQAETLGAFVTQFYTEEALIPREILLPAPLESAALIERWLSNRLGHVVKLLNPQRGPKRALVSLATRNAELALFERTRKQQKRAQRAEALCELQSALDLPRLPVRIECYDISNLQGVDAVGAMTVFERGLPQKSAYRRFHIKTVAGANDVAMLAEVLERRLRRGLAERQQLQKQAHAVVQRPVKFAQLPDLIVLDGGKGQLNAGLAVLGALGLEDLPIVALAKRQEELFLPRRSRPVLLPKDSKALHVLQHVRDEAHRFGVRYHRSLRQRRTVHSTLDDIPGVGPKRRAALLRHFGSLARIKAATPQDIGAVPGIPTAVAQRIHAALHVVST